MSRDGLLVGAARGNLVGGKWREDSWRVGVCSGGGTCGERQPLWVSVGLCESKQAPSVTDSLCKFTGTRKNRMDNFAGWLVAALEQFAACCSTCSLARSWRAGAYGGERAYGRVLCVVCLCVVAFMWVMQLMMQLFAAR